jgi:hypothetical protein
VDAQVDVISYDDVNDHEPPQPVIVYGLRFVGTRRGAARGIHSILMRRPALVALRAAITEALQADD